MRQRLSWDEKKVAELTKKADPYTMNQERQNPPVEKYQTGNPDAWAETPDMAHRWEGEGRTETGHPALAREAVVTARKLEDKALKCLTIAQRMLPCASDEALEEQATDLMYMPENAILATLQRQASLAETLAGAKKKDDDDDDAADVEVNQNAAPGAAPAVTPAIPAAAPAAEAPVAAPKKDEKKDDDDDDAADVAAAAAPKEPAEKPAEKPVEKKPEDAEEGTDVEVKKKVKKDEEYEAEGKKDKEASADLLDKLFENTEVTAAVKAGAKKLSGIVKQASGDSTLDNIWDCPPDISKAF